MKAYESGVGQYFATPPVNLIRAFHASLKQIARGVPSLEDRFQLHRDAAQRVRSAAAELGLKLVPTDPKYTANGMTAVSLHLQSPRLLSDGRPWCLALLVGGTGDIYTLTPTDSRGTADLPPARARGCRSCASAGQAWCRHHWRYSQGLQGCASLFRLQFLFPASS